MITEVSPSNTVVLDGSGNGQCAVSPPSGTKWSLRLATLSTSTAVKHPTGFLYRGSPSGPLQLVDSTFTGDQASSAKVGGAVYYPGQWLWAVWKGGDPGATATLQAFGQQGGRSDPLTDSPLGEGFQNQIALIAESLQLGGDGTPGNPGITLGVTPIPSELVTYYAGLTDPGTLVPETLTIWHDGTSAAAYRYSAIFTDHGVPPGQQVWFVEGLRGATGVVGETDRWLINAGGALGNPDIIFSPSIAFLIKALLQTQVASTGAQAIEVEIAGEAGIRLTVNGDGSLNWGDGTHAADTPLTRVGTGILELTGTFQLVNSSAFNSILTAFVSGDTNPRFTIRGDGQLFWGPGNAATDTRFYRDAPGILAADGIKANIAGVSETWHALPFNAGLAIPWTNAGGGAVSGQYRLNAAPYKTVELIGILTAGTKADGTTIATLPAGYRPAGTIPIPVAIAPPTLAGATTPQLQVQSSGAVLCFGCSSATTVYLNGEVPLDA